MPEIKVGSLGDCPCANGTVADLSGTGGAPVPARRKPRSKGTGKHCVVSQHGKIVHCYESEATAQRVAESFSRRARSRFEVKAR